MAPRTCTLPDCGKPHKAKGLCHGHYNRQWQAGPHETRQQFNHASPEIPPGLKLALRVADMRLALEQIAALARMAGDPAKRLRLIAHLAGEVTGR